MPIDQRRIEDLAVVDIVGLAPDGEDLLVAPLHRMDAIRHAVRAVRLADGLLPDHFRHALPVTGADDIRRVLLSELHELADIATFEHLDHRLVDEEDLAVRLRLRDEQCRRQVLRDCLEIEAERRAVQALHRGLVDAVMVAAAQLDGVERRIRLMEELRERRAITVIERIADRDGERMRLPVIRERLPLVGECLDGGLCRLWLRVLHEDDELIAAIAADDLLVAEVLDKIPRQSAQSLVTSHVSVQVIDELEAVEIETDERTR